MIGDWSIARELAANDMLGAANKILMRCASFAPANSAFQTLLGRGASDNAYWKGQGVRLAQTIIALSARGAEVPGLDLRSQEPERIWARM